MVRTPRVALMARADDRGLGIMTWEFARHLQPDRVMVIDMGPLSRNFPLDPRRFPDALVVRFEDGRLPEADVRAWLDGADVLYSAETFYDARLSSWARAAGVRTVLHAMPEFFRPEMEPDVVWAPTSWRLDLLPPESRMVPVPVGPPPDLVEPAGPMPILSVVHVAGHRAAQDRNGTSILAQALRTVRVPLVVQIECQDRRMPPVRGTGAVRVRTQLNGRVDRWDLYRGADLLVMPRRYGGLSLPVQEAMGAGLGVVMTDVSPNQDWPTLGIRTSGLSTGLATPGGTVEVHRPDAIHLSQLLSGLASDPVGVALLRARAAAWARAHSWDALRPLYRSELARAAA